MNIIVAILLFMAGFFIGELCQAIGMTKQDVGDLKVGTNPQTGKKTYRLEVNVPFDDIDNYKYVMFHVVKTKESLEINRRLYDLESEGITNENITD